MKNTNYKIWAKIIRFLLAFGICVQFLGFTLSIVKEAFNLKTDFTFGNFDYGYRNYKAGYPVKTNLSVQIPDTVIVYQNGTMEKVSGRGMAYDWYTKNTATRTDTIINQIKPRNIYSLAESEIKANGIPALDSVTYSNHISATTEIRVLTDKLSHKVRYVIYDKLDEIFWILISIWIIMLIGNYLKGDFLRLQSFKLMKKIGYSFIYMYVINTLFRFIMVPLIPYFDFTSTSTISGNYLNTLKLALHANNYIDVHYLIIGVGIWIASDIIKNAVLIKKEQDLTI